MEICKPSLCSGTSHVAAPDSDAWHSREPLGKELAYS